LGNPSDGYNGKTISITVKNFKAAVCLKQSDKLEIIHREQDKNGYNSIPDLIKGINLYGYYGGVRLIKAAIKIFYDYCYRKKIETEDKNFTVEYQSTIPRQVGFGGSSAIITAMMCALMKFFNVTIPVEILPSLILDAEVKELGINAGLQDRVIQVYEGCMYMNFDSEVMKDKEFGEYERLDPSLIPPLFIAYKSGLSKVSGKVFNDVRAGYERGDQFVIDTLREIAKLAEKGKSKLIGKDVDNLDELINKNFDLRKSIMNISDENLELVETARSCGASAKFAGSGGAIIGMYTGEDMYERLTEKLGEIKAKVIKPEIK